MSEYHNIMQLMGLIASRELAGRLENIKSLSESEFRVFSQFGDDGIIQYLVRKCRILDIEKRFVEFGVENYFEANTRFLLIKDNWSGLVMDSSIDNISIILNDEISWRHDLHAMRAFVDPDNVNQILKFRGFDRNLGLFSIDIDGMDYWVFHALQVGNPVIIMCEYNSIFGPSAKVTVPYTKNFDRRIAHHSGLYAGASLNALVHLASQKGYCFVGSNSAGNSAYFVRKDRMDNLPVLTSEQGYVESKFRESRNETGRLTFVGGHDRLRLIDHMPIFDLEDQTTRPIRDAVKF